MSIPYNIIELFSKYFLDKQKGQNELFTLLPKIRRGNSFRIMWELYQQFIDNLNEKDICKLFEVIGPHLELKYGGNQQCCAVIWNVEEDNGICYPSRCKKEKFTNYNFCKNHYLPMGEDSNLEIISYKWQQNGSIFDVSIQPCFLKFKKTLYEKNHITIDSKLSSHCYYQFNSLEYLIKIDIPKIIITQPIIQPVISNNVKSDTKPIVNNEKIIQQKKAISNNVKSDTKPIVNNEKIIQQKKAISNNIKQLYLTNLLVSSMISKEIKIDKNNIENIKIYDDPTIYQKDKQFIFKGLKPVGIILDCDTVYMIKDILEELNNHSIDPAFKDAFIETISYSVNI